MCITETDDYKENKRLHAQLATLRAELEAKPKPAFACDYQRLWDLVRYHRSQLADEGLITLEEYTALASEELMTSGKYGEGSASAKRLSSYDDLRAELDALRAELEAAKADNERLKEEQVCEIARLLEERDDLRRQLAVIDVETKENYRRHCEAMSTTRIRLLETRRQLAAAQAECERMRGRCNALTGWYVAKECEDGSLILENHTGDRKHVWNDEIERLRTALGNMVKTNPPRRGPYSEDIDQRRAYVAAAAALAPSTDAIHAASESDLRSQLGDAEFNALAGEGRAAVQDALVSCGECERIVAISGSSRFIEIMAVCAWLIERDENAVTLACHLLPAWYTCAEHHLAEEQGCADHMDDLHLRKIDISDALFVVDFDGYVGESTRREIEYAQSKGKPIRYFSSDPIGESICNILHTAALVSTATPRKPYDANAREGGAND